MDTETILKQIADELGAPELFEEYARNAASINVQELRLGIIGQTNTGKTTVINAVAGVAEPASTIPSGECIRVVAEKGADKAGYRTVVTADQWVKDNKVEVLEVSSDIAIDNLTQVDLLKMLSQCDAYVFLLNSQSALNQTDLTLIRLISKVKTPALVILTHSDLLQPGDLAEVEKYVTGNLADIPGVELLRLEGNLNTPDNRKAVADAVRKLAEGVNVKASRTGFENFFLGITLSKMFEKCQAKIQEVETRREEIEKKATEKRVKLSDKSLEWLEVETELRRQMLEIYNKVRSFLEDRKQDMLHSFNHDIDVCNDVKVYWEKELPYRLETMVKGETQGMTQLLNKQLMKTLQWLQDTLLKKFKCKMSLATSLFESDNINAAPAATDSSEVKIADLNKLKIVTRIGTAATVIGAGALCATAGIGGIVMAASMISGIGAEMFMRKKNEGSREEVRKALPGIMDRTQLKLATDFEPKLQEMSTELVNQLHTVRSEWMEKSEKEIAQEKEIALFNTSASKWENIMGRINQLCELLIK